MTEVRFDGSPSEQTEDFRSRRRAGPSPGLEAACARAAKTAGFLMF